MKSKSVHVAVGVVRDNRQRILVAQRQTGQHLAGLWEFPGGKVESGEEVIHALARELKEEVGITIVESEPLIEIQHEYPEKTVLLDVYCIENFIGEAVGREGQTIQWVQQRDLRTINFPDVNRVIINALDLPDAMAITGSFDNATQFKSSFENLIRNGVKLIQLRPTDMQQEIPLELIRYACEESATAGVLLQINSRLFSSIQHIEPTYTHVGLHLRSSDLRQAQKMQEEFNFKYVSAACHSIDEVEFANNLELDFILLSPVKETQTHLDVEPLGWLSFSKLCKKAKMPVYALGGLNSTDIQLACENGGQGIASISAFWP